MPWSEIGSWVTGQLTDGSRVTKGDPLSVLRQNLEVKFVYQGHQVKVSK